MDTKQLTKDRTYYRQLTNRGLITTVKESTTLTELERVLVERLEKAERDAWRSPHQD
jgi:hypothetical protein